LARDNYSYQKYKKELARKKKQEKKRQRRLERKNLQSGGNRAQVSNENPGQSPDQNTAPA